MKSVAQRMDIEMEGLPELIAKWQQEYRGQGNALRKPARLTELGTVMSNCDRRIYQDIAKKLQTGKYFSQYAAWNFCGYVWYSRSRRKWHCEVWRYNAHVETVTAPTLEGIM